MKHFLQAIYESEKQAADFQRQPPKCQQPSFKVKEEMKTCLRLNEGRFEFGPTCDGFHFKLLAPFATPFSCIIKKKKKDYGTSNCRLGMNSDSNTYLTYLLCDLEKSLDLSGHQCSQN